MTLTMPGLLFVIGGGLASSATIIFGIALNKILKPYGYLNIIGGLLLFMNFQFLVFWL